jgi:hypothetical protein
MLSLKQRPDRLHRADNLLPSARATLATRPGARQIVAGPIQAAATWGDRLLLEKHGRLVVWDGTESDVRGAGAVLSAAAYQALTENAEREDRLYVADGVRPFWYIAKRAGAYVCVDVVNKVVDASNAPYPLPIPRTVANWRERLWIGWGTNRVQHCQNRDPDYWDPLWTPEMQGQDTDAVNALIPHGATLLVGLGRSVWGITGDSQFNFLPLAITTTSGTSGPYAAASDGQTAYHAGRAGAYQLGGALLSEDIGDAFRGRPSGSSVVIDSTRYLLLCAVGGRLFVMHLSQPGLWGEIVTGGVVHGVFRTSEHAGWFGESGAWVLTAPDAPDMHLDGSIAPVRSVYETWDTVPQLGGDGRALLERVVILATGSARGSGAYTLTVDGRAWDASFSLVDTPSSTAIDSVNVLASPLPPVRREFVPMRAGTTFRHRIEAPCHLEIHQFNPKFRGQ